MNIEDLPHGSAPAALTFDHFPTRHQAALWRNWGLIPIETLAKVLGASCDELLEAGLEMGLPPPPAVVGEWRNAGYVTIIRANWHLLPYDQLLQLLDWTPEKMSYHLREEDFLWTKLGFLKPACKRVVFRKLDDGEKKRTKTIKDFVRQNFPAKSGKEQPFDFMKRLGRASLPPDAKDKNDPLERFNENFIYPYFAPYGDALISGGDIVQEGLLERYAKMGVKGLWLQAMLYTLCPNPKALSWAEGWEARIANLRRLVAKAKRHGIGVYLYLNEPRGMPESFFENLPDWKGAFHKPNGLYALCTSKPDTLRWLENACAHVFREVPELAGVFTITMSENITNCRALDFSSQDELIACPRCAARSVAEIIAEVNKAIERGVHSESPAARVMAWSWAWGQDWANDVVDLLPESVELMCVSEWGRQFQVGGVTNSVVDYSLSQPGPSGQSIELWNRAKKRGMKTVAKVQMNCSWECAPIPYLPVPYLVKEHLDGLANAEVDGLMLSWSLGGFPGGNLALLRHSPEELAVKSFGEKAADGVCAAWRKFGEAFRNFPFQVGVLYFAPQNMGPANLLFRKATGYKATMVGLPYDDLETWRANYPEDIFETQFSLLSEGWAEGLAILTAQKPLVKVRAKNEFKKMLNIATAAYCHFKSAFNQIRFVRLRERSDEDARAAMALTLDDESLLAKLLFAASGEDSSIGFEASNHYVYTSNDLIEKALNCEMLKRSLNEEKQP